MFEAGFGTADITPEPGMPLSGFAFRENKPSTRIEDPIKVKALAISKDGDLFLIVSYELLGVSEELDDYVREELNETFPDIYRDENCVLTAVHTHSAPIVARLAGEDEPDLNYIRLISEQTLKAVKDAVTTLEPVEVYVSKKEILDLTYNRRAILEDGRVSMALNPNEKVIERGPVDHTLTLLVFKNNLGKIIGGISHFACHGTAVCTMGVTNDAPGQVANEIEKLIGAPCLYLQGGAGDINPVIVSTTREDLGGWADRFGEQITDILDNLQPIDLNLVETVNFKIPVFFKRLAEKEDVLKNNELLRKVEKGDVTSPETIGVLKNIANIINLPPGELPERSKAKYFAGALLSSNNQILKAINSETFTGKTDLHVSIWKFSELVLIFVGAEMFANTGLAIRSIDSGLMNLLVTYAGPVIGYIPDDEAIERGGYEVVDAWAFYGQPAAFERGSTERFISQIKTYLEK